ncbi:aminotransferase class IV [Hymenobacter sp. 102]|uniref:aminotransferase class IV n=1 Tax=Hymenobacter sp. 102 TaxID=3403152 RepID=UPI003CF62EAC
MVLYNGQLLPADEVRLPLPNRGLFFNDGFFETLVLHQGRIRYLPHHWQRLQRAAQALQLALPAQLSTAESLTATLVSLAAASAVRVTTRFRLQLWRQGGGLYAPSSDDANWLLTHQPFQPAHGPIRTCELAGQVRTLASAVSFCKGPQALTYVLAAQERQQRGLDELILLSAEGYLAETVAASLAWIQGGTVFTPAASSGCVAGTRLAHLRDCAVRAGIGWQSGLYWPTELLTAEAVFTANIAGIRPVCWVQGTAFASASHPLLQRLIQLDEVA